MFGSVELALTVASLSIVSDLSNWVYQAQPTGKLDSVLVPVTQRHGAPADPLAALWIADSSRVFGPFSTPAALSEHGGHIDVLFEDILTTATSNGSRAFLSVIGSNGTVICSDVAIPGPINLRRRFALRRDTLIVAWREVLPDGVAAFIWERYQSNPSRCEARTAHAPT